MTLSQTPSTWVKNDVTLWDDPVPGRGSSDNPAPWRRTAHRDDAVRAGSYVTKTAQLPTRVMFRVVDSDEGEGEEFRHERKN